MYIDLLRTQLNETQWFLAMDETDKVYLWLLQIEANALCAARQIPSSALSREAIDEAIKLSE